MTHAVFSPHKNIFDMISLALQNLLVMIHCPPPQFLSGVNSCNFRQTLLIIRSVLNFCLHLAPRTNTELENFEIENIRVANFSNLPIKLRINNHIDLHF